MNTTKKSMELKVKETIDSIFASTTSTPEGTYLPAKNGFTWSRIVSSLVNRGILEKRQVKGNKRGKNYKYKWNSTMAPTKVLYGAVTDEIRDYNRKRNAKYTKKVPKDTPLVKDFFVEKNPILLIEGISDETLWVELKRRGWEGKIVKTTRQILD